jgi:hypothetical protein
MGNRDKPLAISYIYPDRIILAQKMDDCKGNASFYSTFQDKSLLYSMHIGLLDAWRR